MKTLFLHGFCFSFYDSVTNSEIGFSLNRIDLFFFVSGIKNLHIFANDLGDRFHFHEDR